jgi:transcriptional regulator with XRE-family HTH domain
VSDQLELNSLASKEFRDEYMATLVRFGICYQLQVLREQRGLTQTEFAQKLDKAQTVISRLESVERSRASVQTLLDIACKLDVALHVRFVDYPTFLDLNRDVSPAALMVRGYEQSLEELMIFGNAIHENGPLEASAGPGLPGPPSPVSAASFLGRQSNDNMGASMQGQTTSFAGNVSRGREAHLSWSGGRPPSSASADQRRQA